MRGGRWVLVCVRVRMHVRRTCVRACVERRTEMVSTTGKDKYVGVWTGADNVRRGHGRELLKGRSRGN